MITGKEVKKRLLKGSFVRSRLRVKLTSGEAIKRLREKNELTQEELASRTGLKQTTISALEKNRVNLGLARARILAKALHVHPAVLAFPDWSEEDLAA